MVKGWNYVVARQRQCRMHHSAPQSSNKAKYLTFGALTKSLPALASLPTFDHGKLFQSSSFMVTLWMAGEFLSFYALYMMVLFVICVRSPSSSHQRGALACAPWGRGYETTYLLLIPCYSTYLTLG